MTTTTSYLGGEGPRSWSGSVRNSVRFVPLPKPQATRLFHRAIKRINLDQIQRAWMKPSGRKTPPHSVERVLRALVFDFLNFRSGRLDPSYAAIARAAGCSVRTAKRAVKYLGQLKILGWVRRCFGWVGPDGRYRLDQDTNAYWLNSPEQWGEALMPDAPPPVPDSWGAQPPLPDIFDQAIQEGDAAEIAGASEADALDRRASILEAEAGDPLSASLARLMRARARLLRGQR